MPGYEVFDHEERNAVNELFDANGGILCAHGFDHMRNGIYRVREFESLVSNTLDVPHALAVNSCTAALRVSLAALGVGPGDEVIIPAFTFVATAEAVIQSGANLVIVDIDETFNMDPTALEAAITDQTTAVIPVHMMGAAADMDRISAIAKKYDIRVLEDAAWGIGSTWRGRALGTIGDIGCYSFDAGKCISTGEGGMVVTHNQDLFRKARAYHDHGHEYSSARGRGEEGAIGEGFNYRMTELQGAIGIVQFGKLNRIREAQRSNKATIKQQLIQGGFPFRFRKILDEGESADALFFIMDGREKAEKFLAGMKREGLGTKNVPDAIRWHFAKHWQHMFNKYGWYRDTYQVQWQRSADILESSIALPIMVKMSEEQLAEIIRKLLKITGEIV